MRLIEILGKNEQSDFDNPPKSSPTNMVGFVFSLVYACCLGKFYLPKTFYQSDVTFVCKKLKLSPKSINFSSYNRSTFTYHKPSDFMEIDVKLIEEQGDNILRLVSTTNCHNYEWVNSIMGTLEFFR